MKKMWFVSYVYRWSSPDWQPESEVIDNHPFLWQHEMQKFVQSSVQGEQVLLFWRELTQEDLEVYQLLNSEEEQ